MRWVPTGFPTATSTPVPLGNLTPPYLGKIAFLSRRSASERSQIYVMNPYGSQVTEVRPLTPVPSAELQYPGNHFMSADGSKFLLTYDYGTGSGTVSYLRQRRRNQHARYYRPFGARRYDAGRASRRAHIRREQAIYSPIFAPDGQTLYFLQWTEDRNGNSRTASTGAIYRLAPGETTPTRIAAFSMISTSDAFALPTLTIDAAGTKLAFVNSDNGSSNAIWAVNTDGTGLTRLTGTTGNNRAPAFTTDGTKIIFASSRDGNGELYSINPDGSGETRLTYNIELDEEPATRASKTRAAVVKKAAR